MNDESERDPNAEDAASTTPADAPASPDASATPEDSATAEPSATPEGDNGTSEPES